MGFNVKAYLDAMPKITAEQINKKIKEICPECNCKVYDKNLIYSDSSIFPYHWDKCLPDELFYEAYNLLKADNPFSK